MNESSNHEQQALHIWMVSPPPPRSSQVNSQDKTHKTEVEKTSTVESYALDAG